MGNYPGWRHMSGSSRHNAKLDKTWKDVHELEKKRLIEGHEPNPNLTNEEDAKKYGWEKYKNGQYSRFRKSEVPDKKKKSMAKKMRTEEEVLKQSAVYRQLHKKDLQEERDYPSLQRDIKRK